MTKILIVDDNENMCTTLADILEEKGYGVTAVHSGEEALDKVRNEKPDVILLDIKLPGMDGNKTCREIKKILPTVKVVVYTGYVDAVDAGKARTAGADDFVVKTADFSLLLKAAKKLA